MVKESYNKTRVTTKEVQYGMSLQVVSYTYNVGTSAIRPKIACFRQDSLGQTHDEQEWQCLVWDARFMVVHSSPVSTACWLILGGSRELVTYNGANNSYTPTSNWGEPDKAITRSSVSPVLSTY